VLVELIVLEFRDYEVGGLALEVLGWALEQHLSCGEDLLDFDLFLLELC
jgi:hypothetical protein